MFYKFTTFINKLRIILSLDRNVSTPESRLQEYIARTCRSAARGRECGSGLLRRTEASFCNKARGVIFARACSKISPFKVRNVILLVNFANIVCILVWLKRLRW